MKTYFNIRFSHLLFELSEDAFNLPAVPGLLNLQIITKFKYNRHLMKNPCNLTTIKVWVMRSSRVYGSSMVRFWANKFNFTEGFNLFGGFIRLLS